MSLKAKYTLIVILPAIQDFLEEKGREGIKDIFELVNYIEEKTGVRVAPEWMEDFLDSLVNNSEMFMVMLVNEYADVLSESILGAVSGTYQRAKDKMKAAFLILGGGS